jgi:hypothetical protein
LGQLGECDPCLPISIGQHFIWELGLHHFGLPSKIILGQLSHFLSPLFSNMRAYYYDNTDLDQRELHDSGKTVSLEELEKVGVLYWKFVGDNAQEQLDKMAVERKYKNRDQVRHYERTCWTIHT